MDKLSLVLQGKNSMSYLTLDQAIYGFHLPNVRWTMKLSVVSIEANTEIIFKSLPDAEKKILRKSKGLTVWNIF